MHQEAGLHLRPNCEKQWASRSQSGPGMEAVVDIEEDNGFHISAEFRKFWTSSIKPVTAYFGTYQDALNSVMTSCEAVETLQSLTRPWNLCCSEHQIPESLSATSACLE